MRTGSIRRKNTGHQAMCIKFRSPCFGRHAAIHDSVEWRHDFGFNRMRRTNKFIWSFENFVWMSRSRRLFLIQIINPTIYQWGAENSYASGDNWAWSRFKWARRSVTSRRERHRNPTRWSTKRNANGLIWILQTSIPILLQCKLQ